jgi:hypothetical protein
MSSATRSVAEFKTFADKTASSFLFGAKGMRKNDSIGPQRRPQTLGEFPPLPAAVLEMDDVSARSRRCESQSRH